MHQRVIVSVSRSRSYWASGPAGQAVLLALSTVAWDSSEGNDLAYFRGPNFRDYHSAAGLGLRGRSVVAEAVTRLACHERKDVPSLLAVCAPDGRVLLILSIGGKPSNG